MVDKKINQSVLVILVHPNLHQSAINKALFTGALDVPGVDVHDLYETYSDGIIDIEHEQKLIEQYDTIVFQHPFYWYSAPSLLKEWFDLVLQYNYAYGPLGQALKDKKWLSVITTGGSKVAYCQTGHNRFSMRELLTPFDQTAHLCQMEFLPPFVLHSARVLGQERQSLDKQVENYQQVLSELVSGELVISLEWQLMNERWEQS